MDLAFDLLQAAGIGAAIGIRPLLPVLLVGALAAADLGVDFDGTDFAFLEEPPFLLGALGLLVAFDLVRRRGGEESFEVGPGLAAYGAVAVLLALLEGAGSMADRDNPIIPGLLIGAAGAVLGLLAIRPLFTRVRSRLDAGAASLLPLWREAIALVAAGLSVLFPPLAIVVIGALVWLLAGGRRRDGEKYAGLRILR